MAANARLLKSIRLAHLYFGVFIAPALLFFAFTGFIQTFGLHETARGSSFKPPRILMQLGQLHKKQTLVLPERRPQAPAPSPAAKAATPSTPPTQPAPTPTVPAKPPYNLLPMKLFFALVCIGLVSSTFSGLYMAY